MFNEKDTELNLQQIFNKVNKKYLLKGANVNSIQTIKKNLTVTLQDVMTPFEKKLLKENYDDQQIENIRSVLYELLLPEYIKMLEGLFGMKVIDFSIEINVFENTECVSFTFEKDIEQKISNSIETPKMSGMI